MSGVTVRDFAAHSLVAAGMLLMLSACQSTKHTESMGTDIGEPQAPVEEAPAPIEEAAPAPVEEAVPAPIEEAAPAPVEEPFVEPTVEAEDIDAGDVGKSEMQDVTPDDLIAEPSPPADSGPMPDDGRMGEDGAQFGLSDVFFAFDQYSIDDKAAGALRKNAALLNEQYRDARVMIEGHCDERGTVDYNLELGKRRAQAVKDYLVDLGVAEARIRIVSYGKERPFCTASEPSCWAQNRRGHFLLQR